MRAHQAIIIGAGIGGLSAAIALATRGVAVTVFEQHAKAGGKMREVTVAGRPIDSGPTVFTMRWVFDELFAGADADFGTEVPLAPLDILARHAWREGEHLDLHADLARSVEAIAAFAGPAEAERFRTFSDDARAIYDTLRGPFLSAPKPTPFSLTRRIGLSRLGELFAIRPFETMWHALGSHFRDPRLQQLFGRYATYSGSSPFKAPATLMLIAHVERDGVWSVENGMQRLAEGLQALARKLGVVFHFNRPVQAILKTGRRVSGIRTLDGEAFAGDAVIANADPSAIATGRFGTDIATAVARVDPRNRSLSAMAWSIVGHADGFPLRRHNVFFGAGYDREFEQIFRDRRLPLDPTVYLCAADRDGSEAAQGGSERFLMLVNAPATGDADTLDTAEMARCEARTFDRLKRCGLTLVPEASVLTTPATFERLFPATGGALYGRASHGWMASFQRPSSRTQVPGLYLAGGATHPGAGVPMAALSGRLAASAVLEDLASTRLSRPVAMPGGTSTPSAMTKTTPSR